MDGHLYQTHEVEEGSHILIFDADGEFERKVFVPIDEYNPDCLAVVTDRKLQPLFTGTYDYVIKWLQRNPGSEATMVAIGKDSQLLSIGEFQTLHG